MVNMTNLTPLDQAIFQCAAQDTNWTMVFPDGRSPTIVVTDQYYSHTIFLRDHPDIFMQVGPRAYTITAKARRRFAEICEADKPDAA